MSKGYKSVIFISDLHIPYHHVDSFHFIKAVVDKYTIPGSTKVILSGDELSYSAISYHEKNPDLNSPGMELLESIVYMEELYKIIPSATVLESNHGSLPARKLQTIGLPSIMLKPYNQILNAPDTWNWVEEYICPLSNGRKVFCIHGMGANSLAISKSKSMNFMQGHFHGTFEIAYWNNGMKASWGLTAGCLVNPDHVEFKYGRLAKFKPILGMAVIIEGHPVLIPMILNKHKRWIGRLI